MGTLFHAIFSGAAIGILVLATGAFFFRLVFGGGRGNWSKGADLVAITAIVVGLGFAVLSGITGYFFTWGLSAVRDSLVAQNKTLVTFAMLASYGFVALLRIRSGEAFWRSTLTRLWSAALVAFGFVNLVLVGSMGGTATLKGTVLDPVLWALNINRYVSLSWGVWLNLAVIAVAAAVIGWAVMRRRSVRRT